MVSLIGLGQLWFVLWRLGTLLPEKKKKKNQVTLTKKEERIALGWEAIATVREKSYFP